MSAVLAHAFARLRRRKARALVGAAGIAAAAAMVGAAITVAYGLHTGFDRAADRARLPDVAARFDARGLASVESRLRALPNVRAAAYRLEVGGAYVRAGGESTSRAKLQGVRAGPRGYAVVEGRDLSGRSGEALVEVGLARDWKLRVGDRLATVNGRMFRIVGFALEPDTVAYPLARSPRVYAPYEDVRRLSGRGGGDPVNVALLWAVDAERLDVTLAQARVATFGVGDLTFVTRAGIELLIGRAAGIVIALLGAFSLVALLAAGAMLAASAAADVQRRLEAIGVLRAIGVTPRAVAAGSAIEAALVAAPAAAVGLAVGWLVVSSPTERLLEALNELPPGRDLAVLLAAALVAIVGLVALAAAFPAWRAARRPPVETLRGADVAGVPVRAPLPRGAFGLGMRLALARPLRTAATVVVLAASASVVLLLLTIAALLQRLENEPHAIGRRYQLTVAAGPEDVRRVRAVPGVADAAPRYETYAADSFRLGEAFRIVAFDGDHTAFEAPALVEGRRLGGPLEAEIGLGLAQALDLRPGAVLAAQLPSGREQRFHVVGVVGSFENEGRMVYARAADLLAAEPYLPSRVAIRLHRGADRDAVGSALAAAGLPPSDAGGIASGSAVEGWAARNSGFVDVLVALLRGVSALDGLVCLSALAEMLALTAQERRHAVALVRAVGAGRRQVRALFAGAALTVAALAAPLGVGLEIFAVGPAAASLAVAYVDLPLAAGAVPVAIVVAALLVGALVAAVSVAARAAGQPVVIGLREE